MCSENKPHYSSIYQKGLQASRQLWRNLLGLRHSGEKWPAAIVALLIGFGFSYIIAPFLEGSLASIFGDRASLYTAAIDEIIHFFIIPIVALPTYLLIKFVAPRVVVLVGIVFLLLFLASRTESWMNNCEKTMNQFSCASFFATKNP